MRKGLWGGGAVWWICMQCRRHGFSPWVWRVPMEEDMVIHSCIFARKIPWTEEPGGQQSMGLKRVGHNWAYMCMCARAHAQTHVHTHRWGNWNLEVTCSRSLGVGGGRFESRQSGSIVHVLNWLSNALRTKGLFFFPPKCPLLLFSHSAVSNYLWPHGTAACQASLSFTIFLSLLKLMSIELVIPSNYLVLYYPLLLTSVFPRIRVFSSECP